MRRAKKREKFKERSRKEKHDEVVQERENRGSNEIRETMDGRSDPLKKTESDILQLNTTNRSVIVTLKELIVPVKTIIC